jgi:hypothetical protein
MLQHLDVTSQVNRCVSTRGIGAASRGGQLLAAVAGDQRASDDFAGVIAGTVSPVEFFAPKHASRIVGAPAPAWPRQVTP